MTEQQAPSQEMVQQLHEQVERHKVEAVREAFEQPVRRLEGEVSEQREALAAVSEEFEGSEQVQGLIDQLDETFSNVEQELRDAADRLGLDGGERDTSDEAAEGAQAEEAQEPSSESPDSADSADSPDSPEMAEDDEEQAYVGNGNGGQARHDETDESAPQDQQEDSEEYASASGEGPEQSAS